jgi:peptidoglycan/xylan/chitin deacetylase (PgdA/CDA1 family)
VLKEFRERKDFAMARKSTTGSFWPDGIRLVISISMQFEAGGEPASGAPSPLDGFQIKPGFADYPTTTWYQYGVREGIPRLLDLFSALKIRTTSHMVGLAVEKAPGLAREIVERGHEAAAHGQTWTPQYDLDETSERIFIADNVAVIKRVTGATPRGYNCPAMRGSKNTLALLQEQGFTYHIDDVSTDEPFIIPVNGQDFVVVPYTINHNDIIQFERYNFGTPAFEQQLHDEFDQLYQEASQRRRMMSISLHDRIAGRPARVRSLRRFIKYAQKKKGVLFMRKDEIADIAKKSPSTPRFESLYES